MCCELKKYMVIVVHIIIWAWAPREGWIEERTKINEKGLVVVKMQQE